MLFMMKLYIATPVNARPEPTFAEKHHAALERVKELKEKLRTDERFARYDEMTSGVEVCPLGGFSEARAIGRCVQAVLESDAVYMDEGYRSSKGCMAEFDVARRYGIPVYGDAWVVNWEVR